MDDIDFRDEAGDEFAALFGQQTDPLAEYDAIFRQASHDPFDWFMEKSIGPKGLAEGTIKSYQSAIEQWQEFMYEQGRHPACPNQNHVLQWTYWLATERGNTGTTIHGKLILLNQMFKYFAGSRKVPHPADYNPVAEARGNIDVRKQFGNGDGREEYYLSKSDVKEGLDSLKNIRKKLPVLMQFKLGLRVGEVRNLELSDLSLDHPDINDAYPTLGTHESVKDRRNVVFIASRYTRPGNKSKNPTVLPIDYELRRLLVRWLLIRPSAPNDYLFVNDDHSRFTTKFINRAWREGFYPKYEGTDARKGLRSHYGRHWFTTFFRVEVGMNEALIQYMRGDVITGDLDYEDVVKGPLGQKAIYSYLHGHYEQVREQYIDHIPDFGQ
jgi:integrase/recombinase XerD